MIDHYTLLRMRFIAGLERRLAAIEETLQQLDRGADMIEEARRHFHTLVGLGGTYGYPEITTAARAGEDICLAMRDGGSADREALRDAMDEIKMQWLFASAADQAAIGGLDVHC